MLDWPVTLAFDDGLGLRPHNLGPPSLVQAFLNPMGGTAPPCRPIVRGRIAADRGKLAGQRERKVGPLTTTIIF